jgi:Ca2+-binding EF-hand superfamily protein
MGRKEQQMSKYAVYFTKSYAMEIEAADPEMAIEEALNIFDEEEADSISMWEVGDYVDNLGESA